MEKDQMSVVNMLDHHSKQPRPTGVIARIEDRQRLEYLLADGFVAVIVRSGGVSAHRSYEKRLPCVLIRIPLRASNLSPPTCTNSCTAKKRIDGAARRSGYSVKDRRNGGSLASRKFFPSICPWVNAIGGSPDRIVMSRLMHNAFNSSMNTSTFFQTCWSTQFRIRSSPVHHYATQGDNLGIKPLSDFCARQKGTMRLLLEILENSPKDAAVLRQWAG
jgi:hypothetical protein